MPAASPVRRHLTEFFMGDSGSMLIGIMLAAATHHGVRPASPFAMYDGKDVVGLLAPLIVLAAVVFRAAAGPTDGRGAPDQGGHQPVQPGQDDLHHRLLEIGHSQRRAVLLITSGPVCWPSARWRSGHR